MVNYVREGEARPSISDSRQLQGNGSVVFAGLVCEILESSEDGDYITAVRICQVCLRVLQRKEIPILRLRSAVLHLSTFFCIVYVVS